MTPDLDRLKARIQALRAKTTANGCTEEEALAAAAKVAELLDRHDLSVSDLDLRETACARLEIETRRKQRQPISACIPAIAAYCDCKVWRESDPEAGIRYVFFGLPASLELAQYVHDIVATAMQTEWERHRRDQRLIRYGRDEKGSFLFGMAVSVAERLGEMKRERDEATRAGSGRDLVVVRQAVVEAEFARLDLTLRRGRASGKRVAANAFAAGQEAGRTLTIRPGVGRSRA
ncbi:MAG: hypothetical protein RLZZ501_2528 [Pseudomonadota bacterium]|jgi:hypothetical protein